MEKNTILIIDDSIINRTILSDILSDTYQILEAENGALGLEQIEKKVMDEIVSHGMKFSLGKNYLEKLKGFNLIFRSPSCLPTVPELKAEKDRGAIVTTEIEMLMEMAPCKIVGITGSDGKTTTTSLINAILKEAGYNTFLGGNIGTPLFTKLNEMKPLELSSFQLMGMNISPDISVITNITPNHLNIHKDYQEYIDAKKNIFSNQNESGILILNYDNEIISIENMTITGLKKGTTSIDINASYNNDMGFIVTDGAGRLTKFLDFNEEVVDTNE